MARMHETPCDGASGRSSSAPLLGPPAGRSSGQVAQIVVLATKPLFQHSPSSMPMLDCAERIRLAFAT